MFIPKHYKKEEIFPTEVINDLGDRCWILIDKNLLIAADMIRERYGVITINDKFIKNAGFRLPTTGFAKYSAHKFGKALDLHIKAIDDNYTGQDRINRYNEVRREIIKSRMLNHLISRMEDNIPWLHIDTFNDYSDTILLFNP